MAFGAKLGTPCPITIAGGVLQSTTTTPASKSTADALDERGNIVQRATYGGGYTRYSATYAVKQDLAFNSPIGASNGVESVGVNTSNGSWPTVTITWRVMDDADTMTICGNNYDVVFSIVGCKVASPIGFTTTGKLNSSSATFSCSTTDLADDKGTIVAVAYSGGTATANGTAVQTDGAVTFTPDSGWDMLAPGATVNSSNTAYETATGEFTKPLTPQAIA